MKTRIRSFTAPLPYVLYWDANFVVNFAYEAARYFLECADFLTRLDESQTTSYVSTLTMDEACFVLLRLKVEEDHKPARFWDVYNADPSVIEHYVDELQDLTEGIYTHPRIRLVGTEPSFALEALAHMRAFHFLPRDAYHLATMFHYGIDSIITLDADFLAVPEINIYTCVPAILEQA
ncbi:MAG TPA: PIN domain-containing protein [Chloroflexi bacterium]|nr:PIN domain-containing protein [Chloroflexota bacterium]